MAKYKLTLHLPHALKNVPQRILEGHNDVVVTRDNGYVGELTDEQLAVAKADPYLVVEKGGSKPEGGDDEAAAKAKAEKEAKAAAAAEAKAKKEAEKAAKDAEKAAKNAKPAAPKSGDGKGTAGSKPEGGDDEAAAKAKAEKEAKAAAAAEAKAKKEAEKAAKDAEKAAKNAKPAAPKSGDGKGTAGSKPEGGDKTE